jgi:hypothetical protein
VRKKLIDEWERRSVQKGQGLLLPTFHPCGIFVIVVTSKKMERNYFLEMAHSLHPFPPPHPTRRDEMWAHGIYFLPILCPCGIILLFLS